MNLSMSTSAVVGRPPLCRCVTSFDPLTPGSHRRRRQHELTARADNTGCLGGSQRRPCPVGGGGCGSGSVLVAKCVETQCSANGSGGGGGGQRAQRRCQMDVSSQATCRSGRAPASKTLPVRPPGPARLDPAQSSPAWSVAPDPDRRDSAWLGAAGPSARCWCRSQRCLSLAAISEALV